ncbi:MAG: serine/threonine protein kinase [Gemmataceae bacterium]|nr:serine/threonine protein kinase [Gemmataceae bacterium]
MLNSLCPPVRTVQPARPAGRPGVRIVDAGDRNPDDLPNPPADPFGPDDRMTPRPPAVPPPASPADVAATLSIKAGDTRTLSILRRDVPPEPTDPSPPPPEVGTRVGTFVLQEKLGEGVSCHVFRGWDEAQSCPVALKILNWANVYDRPAAMKQLRTEAAALARVKHPQVVRFLDFGFDPRWPYLVTEFFEGRPLGELLRGGGALPPAWALYLVSQMADALGAVWQAGLVHRDIKPDNILIGPNGNAKLIDFGLAKADGLRASRGEPTGPELAGTAAYLAPEQAKDASTVDHRADIYSLGVTLYEALTGRLPFEGRNRVQVIFQHLSTPPVPPTERAEGIPPLASDLCLWMMAKDPADRPQNYEELRQALNTVVGVGR